MGSFIRRFSKDKTTSRNVYQVSINDADTEYEISQALLSPSTEKKSVQNLINASSPQNRDYQLNGEDQASLLSTPANQLDIASAKQNKSGRRRTTKQLREEALKLAALDPVFEPRKIPISEIMKNYTPCWLAVVGIFASLI